MSLFSPKENAAELLRLRPSEFSERAMSIPVEGKLRQFSLKGREYLAPIYDCDYENVLLCFGRQSEKTCHEDTEVLLANGAVARIADVSEGDVICSMLDGSHIGVGNISWKSRRYQKQCLRIRTRQGHETVVGVTHPMRKWNDWTPAGKLRIGDRIAVVRKAGVFTGTHHENESFLKVTAYLLGDGSLQGSPRFHNQKRLLLDDFAEAVRDIGDVPAERPKLAAPENKYVSVAGMRIRNFLEQSGVWDSTAESKFIPDWVFDLSEKQTALFLNRLWSTDGHCSNRGDSGQYHFVYCSISARLAYGVQRLLWKFGIPSRIRVQVPEVYEDTDKQAYLVQIQTRAGHETFMSRIGALEKTEYVELLDVEENNNRDTLPLAANKQVKALISSGRQYIKPYMYGLQQTPPYCLTYGKFERYLEYARRCVFNHNKALYADLAKHLDTDLFWDEVVSLEDVGEQWCYDISVEGTENFISDGFITHNSTTIGNSCLARSCLAEYHRILFVSPTQTQTETFSRDRLSAPIEQSPTLKFFKGTGKDCADNVLYKKFATGSDITLRYAYLSADRSRGTSAPMLVLDELQDIMVDVIPIVREACSHFEKKTFRFAGTPKTVENTMNVYWENYSTQNEWVIPCDGCGKWNVPDEKNIGKYSLICEKCGKQIYPSHPRAQWASMRDPDWLRNPPLNGVFHGFRIPQIIVSWTKWGEIIDKMEGRGYSRSQFLNECLARAYDTASRLLTRTMLLANCDPDYRVANYELMTHMPRLYMGIDWTGGEDGPDKSATVVTIGGYVSGRFKVIFIKKYSGLEAEEDALMFDIMRMIDHFKIAYVGCDYGGGHIFNKRLIDRYTLRRVYRYQYCGSKIITYDKELARFLVNRTEALMAVVTALRSGTVFSLPSWEDFRYLASDFLNVFQEQDARGNVTISKTPGTQDDALHSLTYCFLASMIDNPRPDIMTPTGIDTSSSAASRIVDSELDSLREEYREYEY